MTQALTVVPKDVAHDMPLDKLGAVMASSGFFKDSRSAAQAVVKIIAGREMGIGAVSAMTGIHIIEGKVAVGAGLLAAAIKRSGRYNYKVLKLTDSEASVEIYEDGKPVGVSSFTAKDAAAAKIDGKPVWKQYPKNMLFARAISNAVRFYCPEVTSGPMYTPEELGAEVNGETGDVINVQVVEPVVVHDAPATEKQAAPRPASAPDPVKAVIPPAKSIAPPPALTTASEPGERGVIESVSERSGEKNGKPWTSYSIKINGEYYSTFDTHMGADAQDWVDREVIYTWKPARNPKYKDILTCVPVLDDTVTYEDGPEKGFMFTEDAPF